MKINNRISTITLFAICFASCKAPKNTLANNTDSTQNIQTVDSVSNQNSLIQNINASGNKPAFGDSALQQLQAKSDLLIISAVLNFAWARSTDYTILAQQNGAWKGYVYKVNMIRKDSKSSLTETSADKTQCDSLLAFLTQHEAWKIKGDFGRKFCDSSNTKCGAINDATTWQLSIVTKKNYISPSYYAPDVYQQCCPNENRALFLSIVKKIESCVSKNPTM